MANDGFSSSLLFLQRFFVMNLKQVCAAVTLFALFPVGPHSPGVWAQSTDTAACPAGWARVRSSIRLRPCWSRVPIVFLCFRGRSRLNHMRGLCRIRIRSGKTRALLFPCWTPRVVDSVSTICTQKSRPREESSLFLLGMRFLFVPVGSYSIPSLNSSEHYAPPVAGTSDVTCDCDTVIYRCATGLNRSLAIG
jgi:hypothetical protein